VREPVFGQQLPELPARGSASELGEGDDVRPPASKLGGYLIDTLAGARTNVPGDDPDRLTHDDVV